MILLSATLSIALATAPPPPRPAPPADARPAPAHASSRYVRAPEGFRAELPEGFAYDRKSEDGRTTYLALEKKAGTFVAVAALPFDSELDCDIELEGAAAATLEPLSTARGLSGCFIASDSAEGRGGMALAYVRAGAAIVSVTAVALRPGEAERLARGVADTVEAAAVATRKPLPRLVLPKADERMIGCFKKMNSLGDFRAFTSVSWTRCYRRNFTFTEQTHVYATSSSHESSASAFGDDEEGKDGLWWLADGELQVRYDAGQEGGGPVKLSERGMILEGEWWERL